MHCHRPPAEQHRVHTAHHDARRHRSEESADQGLLLGGQRATHEVEQMEELIDL